MPIYRVEHETRYDYGASASSSWQVARLTPRALPWQRPLWHRLVIHPVPDECETRQDSHGNITTQFALHQPHRGLQVHMTCAVEVGMRPGVVSCAQPWEAVRDALVPPRPPPDLAAAQAREPSPLLPWSMQARAYAATSLAPGRDWFESVRELAARIHREFEFQPGATTVSTPVEAVLARRQGVCQDFAHLMIACLRAHGLPARYMSGYLLTDPPPGLPRLAGVDASHAWVAAWSPACGWVEFDPTNDTLADERYIVLGWGSDFAEVAPLRGVILGGGEQQLAVRVSVWPQPTEASWPPARPPRAETPG